MKVGDLVRTKHQPWMHDDYDDSDLTLAFIVKIGVIYKIDETGVWVRSRRRSTLQRRHTIILSFRDRQRTGGSL